MIIPFLHKTAAGIIESASTLMWVRVAFFRGRLIHLEYEEEVFEEENKEEAWERLASRVPVKSVPVALKVNPMYRRLHLVEGPVFEDDEDFDQWLEAEIARLIPAGGDKKAFKVMHEIVGLTDSAVRCLVLITRKGAQIPLVQEAEESGFHVAVVTSPIAGMHLDIESGERGWGVLKAENEAILFYHEQGELSVVEELVSNDNELLIQEAKKFVAESGTQNLEAVSEIRLFDEAQDADLLLDGFQVPYRFLSAFWLAVAASRGTTLNALDPDQAAASRDATHRAVFMQSALRFGLVLGAGLLLVTAAMLGTSQLRAQSEAELQQLSGQLAKVEEAHVRVEQLEADLDQSLQLVHLRTHTASLIEQLALRVPEHIWLTGIRYEAESDLVVQGHALDRIAITEFVLSLETAPFTEAMSLQYANEVQASKVYRNVRLYQDRVVQFEITLVLKEMPHGY